ncbi:MAG: hypothetical protein KGS09_18345 [Nitrospirae bacterium]|nr:hypothetical protein [Nitrospirota bacterium]
MSMHRRPTAPLLLAALLLAPLMAPAEELQTSRIEITADYRYAAQETENIADAKSLTCRVRGFLQTEESTRVIRTQLAGGPPSAEGLDQNRALRILSVQEEGIGTITGQYQAVKRLDWLGTHYQDGLRESADIMVDFYDDQGFLIRTDRFPARRAATGDDVMNPGATAILKVSKPPAAKTYRVWLVK